MFAGLYFPTILFIASIATGLVIYYGGNKVLLGAIDVGILYVFISYIGSFFDPVMQLANILARFQQAQASAERLMSLIDTTPEIWDTDEVIEKIARYEGLANTVKLSPPTHGLDNATVRQAQNQIIEMIPSLVRG